MATDPKEQQLVRKMRHYGTMADPMDPPNPEGVLRYWKGLSRQDGKGTLPRNIWRYFKPSPEEKRLRKKTPVFRRTI